ncbi:hypothetical protein GCM10010378_70660 [Streptomyces viridochromogenes]
MTTPDPQPVEEPAVTPPFGPVPPIHIGRPPRAVTPAFGKRAARAVAGGGPAMLTRLRDWLTRSS